MQTLIQSILFKPIYCIIYHLDSTQGPTPYQDSTSPFGLPGINISMNEFTNKLNLHIQPLRTGICVTDNLSSHKFYDLSDLNPELSEFLLSLKIKVKMIEAFYRPANTMLNPHIDGAGGDYSKINWIYGGKESVMKWYTRKPNTQIKDFGKTKINTPRIIFDEEDLTVLHAECLNGVHLVQAGIPHSVLAGDEDRHCLSLVITGLDGRRLTMIEAQKMLSTLILVPPNGVEPLTPALSRRCSNQLS